MQFAMALLMLPDSCIHVWNYFQVRWRTVLWGLGMQFAMALLVLRTSFGLATFQWLGDRVAEFMDHVVAGAEFVFGDIEPHPFAFKVRVLIG